MGGGGGGGGPGFKKKGKKNIVLKHWILPIDHFKTDLFFLFFSTKGTIFLFFSLNPSLICIQFKFPENVFFSLGNLVLSPLLVKLSVLAVFDTFASINVVNSKS